MNPAVKRLYNHEYVYKVRDISTSDIPTLSVQFKTYELPQVILDSEQYTVRAVWIGCVPSIWTRHIAEDWAMKRGIGKARIAAEIEVDL